MVKYEQLESIFKDCPIPVSEYHLENDGEPQDIEVPSAVYLVVQDQNFVADGIPFAKFLRTRIELLTYTIGFEEQQMIESVLESNEINYTKNVEFDEEQKIYYTLYDITVLP